MCGIILDVIDFVLNLIINLIALVIELVFLPFRIIIWLFYAVIGGGSNGYFARPFSRPWGFNRRHYFGNRQMGGGGGVY